MSLFDDLSRGISRRSQFDLIAELTELRRGDLSAPLGVAEVPPSIQAARDVEGEREGLRWLEKNWRENGRELSKEEVEFLRDAREDLSKIEREVP
jgi:hypothetical protein